jgi:hypothetical protein
MKIIVGSLEYGSALPYNLLTMGERGKHHRYVPGHFPLSLNTNT